MAPGGEQLPQQLVREALLEKGSSPLRWQQELNAVLIAGERAGVPWTCSLDVPSVHRE